MKQTIYTIERNEPIAKDIWLMVMSGDTSAITSPGQFINIALEGKFLRRPISVCDVSDKDLTIIYKVVGQGTLQMSLMPPGKQLDVLTGLGNGYDTALSGNAPVLIGGGVGIPPLYLLCKKLIAENKNVQVILGFNDATDLFFVDAFEKTGAAVYVTTADGSVGTKGFVTDKLQELDYTYFYTCGPEAMFKAIHPMAKTGGQYSFEARMGCGFGACMGCSCRTLTGNKRICKEGPVMKKEEILWEN